MKPRWMYRMQYAVIDWLSPWLLMPLARWLDRRPDVCWADACTYLGLGNDLGRFWREGLDSLNGSGIRCQQEARELGTCWCGKMCCPATMKERGEVEPGPDCVIVEPK